MIEVLFGFDGKFHTYRARGVLAYSPEDLAAKLGVPVSDLSIQIDMEAHKRGAPKPKARIAKGINDFSY